jgi:hypothetical protein
MTLRFLGVDPDSPNNGSPTLWEDGDTYVIQGWKINDPAVLSEIGEIPDHETVVRLPKRMMRFFPEANGEVNGGGRVGSA